jgi:hypothetical protein
MKTIPPSTLLCIWLVSYLGLAVASGGGESAPDARVRAAVSSFHAHIEPVWHRHYPEKDVPAIRVEIPALKRTAQSILGAARAGGSPGALEAAERLVDSVDALSTAAATGNEGPVLVAVERLHDSFHSLITALEIRPNELH